MDPYYKSRYVWDDRRSIVWKEIVRFLSKFISKDSKVLDLGAGYCDFINNVNVKNKIALDYSTDLPKYAKDDVEKIISPVTKLEGIDSKTVDVAFASNLLEHLDDKDLELTMAEIKRVLKNDGRLILMQPNYRLSHKTYFDDPTHKKVFSDISLKAFLQSHGFNIELSKPRFLPFSMKSNSRLLPNFLLPFIVRSYIWSPWKPFAGQMLFVAKLKL